MQKLIGRTHELELFNRFFKSKKSEFIALYGRRRVGKTFLVRHFSSKIIAEKGFFFELTGIKDSSTKNQLINFAMQFSKLFYPHLTLATPKSWRNAFETLTEEIEKLPSNKKIFLFFDELPWLAGKKSNFMSNLDYFWNTSWSKMDNVKLVVCGSAASWMLDHLINDKGGLHNRITTRIHLSPLNLRETKEFLRQKGVRWSDQQILECYMIMGGIPYYLDQLDAKLSLVQNIDQICFKKDGLLYDEFPRIFKSLFEQDELNLKIVELIWKSGKMSREELMKKIDYISSGGTFSKRITELEAAGFIQSFVPYQNKNKDKFFRVIDEYACFYLEWIAEHKGIFPQGYWASKSRSPSWISRSGYLFENVCFKHIEEIRTALLLNQIAFKVGAWRFVPKKGDKLAVGAEIDLLFDRDDQVITLIEIKYSHSAIPFIIDKSYAKQLSNKIDIFVKQCAVKKQVTLCLITVSGVKENMYSEDLHIQQITLKDLFS
ncbi:MAG: AAA family ATPase [Oligoflexia bacterium]|nr:AAA family ATPase [Oligoflexia bacterium]